MKKLFLLLLGCSFFEISCNSGTERVPEPAENNSTQEKSPSKTFSGKYSGVTPCADCPGIETTIFFTPDSVFIETLNYLDRNVSFSDTGRWIISDKIIAVSFPGKPTERFFLIKSDSTLAMLDAEKKEIEGNLAAKFILKKAE